MHKKIDRKKLKKNMISIKILGLDSGEKKWKNRTRVSIITKKIRNFMLRIFSSERGFEPSTLRVYEPYL